MPRSRLLAAAVALVSAVSLGACGASSAPPPVQPAVLPPPPSPPKPEPRFHALLINGGGNPSINYQPHLLHLRAMRDALRASGIPDDRIAIFASDGADPAPDLSMREARPEGDAWILQGTRLEHPLAAPTRLVSSEIPGVTLQPATKDGLKAWFESEAHVVQPGDTLLLYVTDHGDRTGPDPMTNAITLWNGDHLSVTELRDLIHELPAGVRIVSLMSQCFSGGFAGLSATSPGDPPPAACGYFSSTAERPAYGCFPENVGKERVGHSFLFLRALGPGKRFEDAHEEVLAADDTPDVPMRSSDAFLADVLHEGASARSVTVDALVAEMLGPAWRDQPAWEHDRQLVDRVAAGFGLQAPASYAELDQEGARLGGLDRRLDQSGKAWSAALADATGDNLQSFLKANPPWNERLSDTALSALAGEDARAALSASLIGELLPWTHKDKGDRLDTIEHKGGLVEGASYRTAVRLAAALRIRTLLVSLAGRTYLERFGSASERDRYAALRACEDVTLPGVASAAPPPAPAEVDAGAPFTAGPSIDDDARTEQSTHPSWMGISFSSIRDDVRKERHLPDGASLVTTVLPTSPAQEAGLAVGDIILGTPGKPFTAHNQVRAWTMLSAADQPGTLEVLRGGKRTEVTLRPRLLPLDLPQAAANNGPAIGDAAPAVDLRRYRGGDVSLKDGKPHLLLFWATWCGPCKASLPEVLAYERKHHTQVVAITAEAPSVLDAFFKKWKQPFPKTVAIDDFGTVFASFGISVTPGFFLVDGKGVVRARASGYSNPPGLPIDGWKWDGK